jgi:hypothetical protein
MRYTALATALVFGLAVTACSRPAEDTTVADTAAPADSMSAMATGAAASAVEAEADAVEARGEAAMDSAKQAGETR